MAAALSGCTLEAESNVLVVGATTTLEDTGLLERLLAAWDSTGTAPQLRALTGGTGQVLALGRRGDVDVVITHDAVAESAFVAEGAGIQRIPLMASSFIIAGPASDPAGAAAADAAASALAAIARRGATFITRGDDSGTHRRELALWQELAAADSGAAAAAAAAILRGHPPHWYVSAGLGMADALRLAGERNAYILSERATFEQLSPNLPLQALSGSDPILANPYAVTIVAATDEAESARAFVRWLISSAAQRRIAEFARADDGTPLFQPARAVGVEQGTAQEPGDEF